MRRLHAVIHDLKRGVPLDRKQLHRAFKCQPVSGDLLENGGIPRGEQGALPRRVSGRQAFEHPARLTCDRFAVIDQLDIGPHLFAQVFADKRVVGAAQHQRVDLPNFSAKLTDGLRVICTQCYYFCSVFALDGISQTIAGLANEIGLTG